MTDTIYLVTVMEEQNTPFCEVFVFHALREVNLKLEELTYGNVDEEVLGTVNVYRGVLLPAHCIPPSFNGTAPYIMIRNPNGRFDDDLAEEAYFWKGSADTYEVAERIEDVVGKGLFGSTHEDIKESLVTIDDIRLFFGYQMLPIIQVSRSDFDEEVAERLETIQDKVVELINQTGVEICQVL